MEHAWIYDKFTYGHSYIWKSRSSYCGHKSEYSRVMTSSSGMLFGVAVIFERIYVLGVIITYLHTTWHNLSFFPQPFSLSQLRKLLWQLQCVPSWHIEIRRTGTVPLIADIGIDELSWSEIRSPPGGAFLKIEPFPLDRYTIELNQILISDTRLAIQRISSGAYSDRAFRLAQPCARLRPIYTVPHINSTGSYHFYL